MNYSKDVPRKYNGRYSSGKKVQIPEWLPASLRKYRRETKMSPSAIAMRIPKDHNGLRVSANAVSNLMNNDLGRAKVQERVGATLLGHITMLITEHNAVKDNNPVTINNEDKVSKQQPQYSKDTVFDHTTGYSEDTQEIEFKEERRGKVLNATELIAWYLELDESDQAIITTMVGRLQPTPDPKNAKDPRYEAINDLLDFAAKLENDLDKEDIRSKA